MREDKIKILCQGFKWSSDYVGIDFNKMSFVHNVNEAIPFTDEIDLCNFIKQGSIGDIEWALEELAISEDGKSKEHFYLSSDFSFDVINIKINLKFENEIKNISLAEWFKCKADTTFNKYKVRVQYKFSNGYKTIWMGVIEQNCIEYTESNDNNNGIIKIKAYGYEKQIKEYLEKIPLPNKNDKPSLWQNTDYNIRFGAGNIPVPYIELQNWLSHTNLGTDFNSFKYSYYLDSDISFINKNPTYGVVYRLYEWAHIHRNNNGMLNVYQCGYDELPQETCWSFLVKLCNSMGWIFFFAMKQPPNQNADTELTFFLRDRFSKTNTNQIIKLDRNKISKNGIKWNKGDINPSVHCIIIQNGELKGGYSRDHLFESRNSFMLSSPFLWGNRIIPIYLCDYLKYKNKNIGGLHFFQCDYDSSSNSWVNFNYQAYAEQITNDDNNYVFRTVKGDVWNVNDEFIIPVTNQIYTFSKKDVLILDAGKSTIGTMVYPNECRHETGDMPSTEFDWRGIWFTGNYGAMLGVESGVNGINYYFSYEDFSKSEQFKNNFLKLLDTHTNLNCELDYNEILFNPLATIQLETEAGSNIYDNFSISKLKINLEKQLTTLTLIK